MRRLFLLCLSLNASTCVSEEQPHKHHQAHPRGHDHHQQGHGHEGVPTVGFTLWSDEYELFSEHSPGQVGHPVSFLLHLTTLEDFSALEEANLILEFDGPEKLRVETSHALSPGIFLLQLTPRKIGSYRGRLHVGPDRPSVVEGLELSVFQTFEEVAASVAQRGDQGVIEFLKEQQWGVPFATAFVTSSVLTDSVVVSGRVATPPGGMAVVGAPVTGSLVSPKEGLPRPGAVVRQGQVLASLIPAPSSPEAVGRSTLAVAEASARLSAAQRAFERAERLIQDEAISKRALEDTGREYKLALEAVNAAQISAKLHSGARKISSHASWRLTAPIDGTLVEVLATPGATVSPGKALFRIIDTRELWVVARVPEQDAAHLRDDLDASFRITGLDTWLPISIIGAKPTASVVTIGRTVDPLTRTVEVIYSLHSPDDNLRVGGLVEVNLPTGASFEGVAIPTTALLNRDGRHVVYVQVDGEHFRERPVRPGPRSGALTAIRQGLEVGERIVTRGAQLVRLADQSKGGSSHGHIH
jgi:membrane fusion protein, heavy metal efflux system